MGSKRAPLAHLSELSPGQQADFFALLVEKTRGLTRDGKPYYTCRFRDHRRTASFMVWSDSTWLEACEHEWQVGQGYKIRAIYGEHEKYGPQLTEVLIIRPIEERDRAEGFDPDQLVDRSRFDPAQMLTELVELVHTSIEEDSLRRLVLELLDEHAGPLQRFPATRDRFYPFLGGLLEHTLSVTRLALQLVGQLRQRYPELDPPLSQDLVVAGAVLHDLGRLLELGEDPVAPAPTVAGRLLGHIVLGRDLVRDKARELGDIPEERLQLLEHVLLSHLTLPEWGSPRLPLIPEVLILHHADDLDAKMEMYARCLTRDPGPGPFTERDPHLGRQLLKTRSR